jgi:hypothetical protein
MQEEVIMWKPVGVVGLWLALIAVPHLSSPAVQVSSAGIVPVAMNVPTDDPGDPFLEGADAGREAAIPSSVATIHFKNALDKTLTLVTASLYMDGQPLQEVMNLAPQADNIVFSGHVAPGAHVVTTHLTCHGRKRGVFTYLTEYKWQVSSEQTLNVLPNRAMVFTISAVRHKGMNVPVDKQVDISVYNELLPEPTSLRN